AKGFILLGLASLGADIALTRRPVNTFDDLRAQRLWFWNEDAIGAKTATAMGYKVVPLPLESAAAAYDRGEIDGFVAVPSAALAFQWQARARYYSRLGFGLLPDCVVIARPSYQRLAIDERKGLLAAAAKLSARSENVTATEDARL